MKRSIERRKHITRQLDSLALPWRFWDAVDGKELSLETVAHRNQTHWWRVHRGRMMNKGEIGCYLSHYEVWKHIVREEYPAAIVLEDDAVLQDNFESIIRALVDFHCQWDIVLLSTKKNYKKHLDLGQIGNTQHRLVRFNRRVGRTGAYCIACKAAETLIQYAEPIRAPIDWTYAEWWQNGLNFYATLPATVRHGSANALSTTINTESRKVRRSLREHFTALRYRIADAWRLKKACRQRKSHL